MTRVCDCQRYTLDYVLGQASGCSSALPISTKQKSLFADKGNKVARDDCCHYVEGNYTKSDEIILFFPVKVVYCHHGYLELNVCQFCMRHAGTPVSQKELDKRRRLVEASSGQGDLFGNYIE